jgi:uncharacterized protein (DUF2235 family)
MQTKLTPNFNTPPSHRKIVILMDGTWNDENGQNNDGLVTNIVHLSRILNNDPEKQVVQYHRGVGNDDDNNWFEKVWGGASGKGVQQIINNAYINMLSVWKPGDELYIFGFSRGAAAARMLCSKIYREGIPQEVNVEYDDDEQNVDKYTPSGKIKHIDVSFLGVWDTVSAFGIIGNLGRLAFEKTGDLFTNNHISPNIQRAVHLVAIDESRKIFAPSLMNHKEGVTHEIWFPGVHSDIGGSYKEDQIAGVSLHYMFQKLNEWIEEQQHETLLIDEENLKKYTNATPKEVYFHYFDDNFTTDEREIFVQVEGEKSKQLQPKIHAFVLALNKQEVQAKKLVKQKKSMKTVSFVYNPTNIERLAGKYIVIE